MAQTNPHACPQRDQLFQYVLRLSSLAAAENLESHLAGCDDCAGRLGEVTNFCELLRQALKLDEEFVENCAAGQTLPANSRLHAIFPDSDHLEMAQLVSVF